MRLACRSRRSWISVTDRVVPGLPHVAFAFIGGIGVHSRSFFLSGTRAAVWVDRLGARFRGHDEEERVGGMNNVADSPMYPLPDRKGRRRQRRSGTSQRPHHNPGERAMRRS